MDENLNKTDLYNQSRIEKLEREYEDALRKEMNILDETNFWSLESSEQWQYIQYLEGKIKSFSKNIIQEAKKQSLQGYTLQNFKIPEFLEENEFWELERESQWFYVNNSLAEKYWDLRIELRNISIRPGLKKIMEITTEIMDCCPEFRKSIDEDQKFYNKLIKNGYKIEFRKMF